MKRFLLRKTMVSLLVIWAMTSVGCWGLSEGIHVSRDAGKSTSRFRYEFEMIPNAVVMREDTEPRWQLGRYVFVRGADRILVVSRITSWSETATKKQRESGDIPDMKDQILERLWITIPQGTAVGQELDLHALSYRFLASYDQGNVADEQFARPFRALGNVRVVEEGDDYMKMRIRLRVTTDLTTAWDINEDDINVPVTPNGRNAKQAEPDAVIYSLSRPGELPSTGLTPVQITPEMSGGATKADPMTQPATPANGAEGGNDQANTTPPAMTNGEQDANPDKAAGTDAQANAAQGDAAAEAGKEVFTPKDEGETVKGKWYSRTQASELFLQLNEDGSFIHSAARPHAVPAVVKGEWRVRGGYLVLHIKSIVVGKVNHMKSRKDNPYAMLKMNWSDTNRVVMDGDMPAMGGMGGRYEVRRAEFPDMSFIPAMTYLPDSPEPRYVGEEPAKDEEKAKDESGEKSKDEAEPKPEAKAGDKPDKDILETPFDF